MMDIDWSKCIVCQKKSSEELHCPSKSKRTDVGAGYRSFIDNIREFNSLGALPIPLNKSLLEKGNEEILSLLAEKKASWHKNCRDKFNNTKLQRAQKRKREDSNESSSPIKARRYSQVSQQKVTSTCFLCEKDDKEADLHAASSFTVDKKVNQCATLLRDGKLLAKLSAGDMIAIEAQYHGKCLTALYNRARNYTRSINQNEQVGCGKAQEELAFIELIAYIEEMIDQDNLVVFKLADLAKVYSTQLQEHQAESGRVNTTRLKERILRACPNLSAHAQGRDILIAQDQDTPIRNYPHRKHI